VRVAYPAFGRGSIFADVAESSDRSLLEPHPSRLPLSNPSRTKILAAHKAAVEAGYDTYVDPDTGLSVFTAAFLLARGTCCDGGCRHCPYVR
jgi:hypothetical protein